MTLVIIGAGNVATVLGRLFIKNGHSVLQVVSRSSNTAQELATELACDFTDNSASVNMMADIYLVAIADKELVGLGGQLQLGNKLVVHTAGSVSKDVLKNISNNYGVIYPLQSLRKHHFNLQQDIPLLIDANTDFSREILLKLAKTISNNTRLAGDEMRMKLHVAAVFVSNFTNHLYELAALYCDKEGADFKLLLPLIGETAIRLQHYKPYEMRTGPAARKDMDTISAHLKLLDTYPELTDIYLKMTSSIINLNKEIKTELIK